MTSQVHSITDAPLRHSTEQHARMVRYTIAMSTRVVCFVLAAVVGVVWQSWWAAVFVAAAIVLPYVAVVDANAGGDRYQARREAEGLTTQPRRLSTGGDGPPEEPRQWWEEEHDAAHSPGSADGAVITGELDEDRTPDGTPR